MKQTTKTIERLPTGSTDGQHPSQDPIPEDETYWREYLGEYLDETEAQELLGIDDPNALRKLVARHDILAVPTARGVVFPSFQFVGGALNPTISRVIQIFSSVVATPYTTASWLRGARFGDKSVAEWLASGEDPQVVIEAAEDSAARLAA
jgi:hypothetical protein